MLTIAFFLVTVSAQVPMAQPPAPPANTRRIDARDGDTVVIPAAARVRLVQRREGTVRAIFNSAQRWLVLLVDYAEPGTGTPDGNVDASFRYDEVDGSWPLGERWEGHAIIDTYSMAPGPPGIGIGLTVNGAFVQLLRRVDDPWFADPSATAILSARSGGGSDVMGGPGQRTFESVETRAVADAVAHVQNGRSSASTRTTIGPGGVQLTSRVGMSGSGGDVNLSPAPVRVGGNIPLPTKIKDVRPALPDAAAQAGVRGVVILEIVIAPDGSVQDAKILRSIPLLDAAALDAVRQWRYTPTLLNGQPVPVILTATVAFQ
jgi:TonB family protein